MGYHSGRVAVCDHATNAGYASDDEKVVDEDWSDECDTACAFLDHHTGWQRVMAELTCVVLSVPEYSDSDRRRSTTLLDRRGRSFSPIYVPPRDCDVKK